MPIWVNVLQQTGDSVPSIELLAFLPDRPMCLVLFVPWAPSTVRAESSTDIPTFGLSVLGILWMLFDNQIEMTLPLLLTLRDTLIHETLGTRDLHSQESLSKPEL